jgi:hypothetical protein
VCACLAAQFAFFSRADSGVLLTDINVQGTSSTFSINQSAKNVARIQAAPSSSLPECSQFKTIQTTASTSFNYAGKCCVLIETRTYTGPWQTTRRPA